MITVGDPVGNSCAETGSPYSSRPLSVVSFPRLVLCDTAGKEYLLLQGYDLRYPAKRKTQETYNLRVHIFVIN